jgi:N-acetylglutamate synthase-like GNAT family acetyltransferase
MLRKGSIARCSARSLPRPAVEFHVRSARVTDVDQAIRVLVGASLDPGAARDAGDMLRQLMYLPSATALLAVADRRILGVGVLAMRPSVRLASFIGSIDELTVLPEEEIGPERAAVAERLLEQLLKSARNKGCSEAEVTDPIARADPGFWKRMGFARRGTRLGRQLK